MKKNPASKYIRSWNLCLELDLAITFWVVLLMMSFEDLILIFYMWVPKKAIVGAMKKMIEFKQHFATTFIHLTKTNMVLVYRSTFCILGRACSSLVKIKM